jgi:isoleucyl-tRNA synthetase
MFKKASARPNFPEQEEQVISFWDKNNIFKKSVEQRTGCESFILYEGPPTANGRPGIHHLTARAFKDVMPRYKAMKGYYTPRIAGWDTHGLPVELQVEKELGIKSKPEIESYGIAKFNQHCKQSVWTYKDEWTKFTQRMGYWVDLDNAYITYENNYIESVWGILKRIWEKNLIYKDYRVVPYCSRCGTSLSTHEVAQGYEDTKEESVFVKFALREEENTFVLAWTTTPWTLPSNVALAVNPKIIYYRVKVGSSYYYLAGDRIDIIDEPYEIISEVKGTELEGKAYYPLYENDSNYWKIVLADFVGSEDGTGIVHIAPAFGAEDMVVAKDYNLSVIHGVTTQGELIIGPKEAVGKFTKDADKFIIDDLEVSGLLYKKKEITHSYPFCWRCKTALIYYAQDAWFIKMTEVREKLIKNNKEINWVPDYIKDGRFGNFLDGVRDWDISRKRFWGTPMPIWKCLKCHKYHIVGSFAELTQKTDSKINLSEFDPHRPFIDEIYLNCDCGGKATREPDVIDVWFDSGAMPYAQWHYPVKNAELFEERFPADFICEAIDQTRGWFYTLLAIATCLDLESPYKNVICLGHIVDEKGLKMSKSKGNIVDPWEVISTFGADTARWWMYSASVPGNFKPFSINLLRESSFKFVSTLWNSYSFFVTYANIHNFQPKQKVIDDVLDKWVISKLNSLIKLVNKEMDDFNVFNATRKIEDFVADLSNWYIRRSRKRFADGDLEALNTLYEVLVTVSKLIAPMMPFLAEEFYQNLAAGKSDKTKESVHLEDYPEFDSKKIDKKLEQKMQVARKFVEMGLNIRNENGIKVRQPLSSFYALVGDKTIDSDLQKILSQELNIKTFEENSGFELPVKLEDKVKGMNISLVIDIQMSDELKKEGLAREALRKIQVLRKESGLSIEDNIALEYFTDQALAEGIINSEIVISGAKIKEIKAVSKEGLLHKLTLDDFSIWLNIYKR